MGGRTDGRTGNLQHITEFVFALCAERRRVPCGVMGWHGTGRDGRGRSRERGGLKNQLIRPPLARSVLTDGLL